MFSRGTSEPPRVVAVVHLPALPGAPRYDGHLAALVAHARAEALALEAAGADALIVENFGDVPFFPGAVPPVTVAAMAVIVAEVVRAVRLPVGVNVLRNDARAALAVAMAAGAGFVRVNVHTGARVTDQGLVQGLAHETLRERRLIGAEHVSIFADVHVKHSAALAERSIVDEARELAERGGADAVLVTGSGTGAAPDAATVAAVREALDDRPLYVASGVTAENAAALLRHADGCIIGSALKHRGDARREVDGPRARAVIAHLKSLSGAGPER